MRGGQPSDQQARIRDLLKYPAEATFVFREKGDGLETVHIHNSVPFSEIQDDELFPVESGRQAFERLKSALDTKKQEYEHQTRFLEQLYHTLPCGILQFSTDPSRTIISVNPMVWRFYGYASESEYREAVRIRSRRLTHRTRSGSPRFSTASP